MFCIQCFSVEYTQYKNETVLPSTFLLLVCTFFFFFFTISPQSESKKAFCCCCYHSLRALNLNLKMIRPVFPVQLLVFYLSVAAFCICSQVFMS